MGIGENAMINDDDKRKIDAKKYLVEMRPIFISKALFSDTTENYISPAEPNPYGNVSIRFRTANSGVDSVYLISSEGEKYPMSKVDEDKAFDYYECTVTLNQDDFYYYFEIHAGRIRCTYDARGVSKEKVPHNLFRIIPGYHTPAWAKGAVMYQIYVERFCNGDPTNDVENGEYFYVGGPVNKVEDWYKIPNVDGTKEFYGGDLQGVIDKLPYLKGLGIDCIYFNPLFVSPSNHKYDSQDYEHIDPHFGKIVKDGGECLEPGDSDNRHATKYQTRVCSKENLEASDELFKHLVEEAHRLGIRVILDGVFNHCGSFNKWLDRERIYEDSEDYAKGAYVSADSPYRKFFDFRSDDWPYNGNYDGWWGYDTLPKLNYEASHELFDKVMDIAAKWVSKPYNVDGWRLDVAADIGHSPEFNHEFFKRFRRYVKDANPEALILAEHYGDPASWLNGKEWDSVMNYDGFMEPVTWFLTGMQKHSDDFRPDMLGNSHAFWEAMWNAHYRLSNSALSVSMNQLSNHDHSRFLTRTNGKVGRSGSVGAHVADEGVDKAIMRQAVIIQMTWTGAPTIYYGDEAGLTGFTDPDNRRTYPWGREDQGLIEFHREMINIHKASEELMHGSLMKLVGEPFVIGYGRFTKDNATIVLINRDTNERKLSVSFMDLINIHGTAYERIMYTDELGYDNRSLDVRIEANGKHEITMPPISAVVIRSKRKH